MFSTPVSSNQARELVQSPIMMIQAPFYSISEVLSPQCLPSAILANLVSSPSTPLYTALVFLLPSCKFNSSSYQHPDHTKRIPLQRRRRSSNSLSIVWPLKSPSSSFLVHQRRHAFPAASHKNSPLSAQLPPWPSAQASSVLPKPFPLRSEAADRFLRWREVERVVDEIHSVRRGVLVSPIFLGRDRPDKNVEN
jgi:hypothetical protein